jgi:transposase
MITFLLNQETKMVIAIDRTSWKFGQINHNLLTLAIVIDTIAVPLFIVHLDHPGNSDTKQRIDLTQNFIDTFGISILECVTADREFVGEDWIEWLGEKKIPFVIRSRTNLAFKHPNGGSMLAKNWFDKSGQEKSFPTKVERNILRLTGKYLLSAKEFLIVMSSPGIKDPLEMYRKRWGIECLFKAMKRGGFNMEDSHIKIKHHFETLTKILCIAFAISVKVGMILNKEKPIPFRKTVNSKIVSLARYGMDHIKRFFHNSQRLISIRTFSFGGLHTILGIFVT